MSLERETGGDGVFVAGGVVEVGVRGEDEVVACLETAKAGGIPNGEAPRVAVPNIASRGVQGVADCEGLISAQGSTNNKKWGPTVVELLCWVINVNVTLLSVLCSPEVLSVTVSRDASPPS